MKKKHDHYPKKTIHSKIIITFLILTIKNFILNSKFYLQIKGGAIGTICAPSYVNTFMLEFEEKYIHPLIKTKSVIYLCYIDDFTIWIKFESKLRLFMNEINQKHQSIKLDFMFSKQNYRISEQIIFHRQ